jgi:hypothetical protein
MNRSISPWSGSKPSREVRKRSDGNKAKRK